MATLEEHGDLNLSLDASDSPEHKYTTNVDTPHRAELSAVNLSFSGSESPATTPTDTTSSHAGSEPPKFVLQPGNAFSLKAFRESEESKLPRRRPGKS